MNSMESSEAKWNGMERLSRMREVVAAAMHVEWLLERKCWACASRSCFFEVSTMLRRRTESGKTIFWIV
jgi:hypothetical protein